MRKIFLSSEMSARFDSARKIKEKVLTTRNKRILSLLFLFSIMTYFQAASNDLTQPDLWTNPTEATIGTDVDLLANNNGGFDSASISPWATPTMVVSGGTDTYTYGSSQILFLLYDSVSGSTGTGLEYIYTTQTIPTKYFADPDDLNLYVSTDFTMEKDTHQTETDGPAAEYQEYTITISFGTISKSWTVFSKTTEEIRTYEGSTCTGHGEWHYEAYSETQAATQNHAFSFTRAELAQTGFATNFNIKIEFRSTCLAQHDTAKLTVRQVKVVCDVVDSPHPTLTAPSDFTYTYNHAGSITWKATDISTYIPERLYSVYKEGIPFITSQAWTSGSNIVADVSGFAVGGPYSMRIDVNDGMGGFATDTVLITVDADNPDAPTLNAPVKGDGQISLTWIKPSYSGGVSLTGYKIYRGTTSNPTTLLKSISGADILSWIDTTATNGITYYYRITAINSYSKESTYSNEQYETAEGYPDAPTDLSLTPGDGSMALQWKTPVETGGFAITQYYIYRGTSANPTTVVHSQASTATTYQTWTDTSVTNGVTYYYRIRCENSVSKISPYSAQDYDYPRTVPNAPTNVQGAVRGDEYLKIQWTAPSYNGGATIDYYTVFRATNAAFTGYTTLGTTSNLYYEDTNSLTNGNNYYYKVSAHNIAGSGSMSTVSSALIPYTSPTTPTLNSITPGDQYLDLTWSAPTENGGVGITITNYNIYRGTSPNPTTLYKQVGNVLSYHDDGNSAGLTNGQIYYYRITAINNQGAQSGYSNQLSDSPFTASQEPHLSSVVAGSPNTETLVLTWTAPAQDGGGGYGGIGITITNYKIYRDDNSGFSSPTLVATVGNVLTATDSVSLTNGITYYYRITAINSESAESAQSNQVSGIPYTTSNAATLLTADRGDAHINITWQAPSVDGDGGYGGVGVSIVNYYLYRSTTINDPNPTLVTSSLSSGTFFYEDTGLSNGVTYYYKIKVLNSMGALSTFSNELSNRTATNPYAPQNLAINSIESQIVNLIWEAPSFTGGTGITIDHYNIYRSVVEDEADPEFIGTSSTLTYSDSALTNGVIYYYRVSAVSEENLETQYPYSNELTTMPVGQPSAPTITIISHGDSYIDLTWTAPAQTGGGSNASIDHYIIYRKLSSNSWTTTPFYTTSDTSTSFHDTSVTNGQSYDYKITAVSDGGINTFEVEGLESNVATDIPARIPYSPVSPTATASDEQITLNWIRPNNGGNAIINYNIYRGTELGGITYLTQASPSGTASETFTDTGAQRALNNGETYYYVITAINAEGEGENTTVTISETPYTTASAPQSVQISSGNQIVTLIWSAPADDGGASVTSYRIYRGTSSDSLTFYLDIAATSLADSSVTNGIQYWYKIAAINRGGPGDNCSIIQATPTEQAPSAPTSVIVTNEGDQTVTFTWSKPLDEGGASVTAYRIYRGTVAGEESYLTEVAKTVGDGESFTDNGAIQALNNGVTYYYRITAVNIKGEGTPSSSINARPYTIPDAPEMNTIIEDNQELTISWEQLFDGGRITTAYYLYRGTNAGYLELYQTLSGNVYSYIDNNELVGLTNGQEYFYLIQTRNIAGYSENSSIVSGTPRTVPDAPTALSISQVLDSALQISWTSPGTSGNGGSPITGFVIFRGLAIDSMTELATIGLSTSYNDDSLTNGLTYFYTVAAINEAGNGANASTTSGMPYTIPSIPLSFSLTEHNGYVELNWAEPYTGGIGISITTYHIYRGTTTSNLIEIDTVSGTIHTYNDVTVTNGIGYYYCISADNGLPLPGGISSNTSKIYGIPIAPPSAPEDFTLTSHDSKVEINWNVPSNDGGASVEGYYIYRGSSASTIDTLIYTASSIEFTYNDTGLVNGQFYYYKISAYNNGTVYPGGEGELTSYLIARPITVPSAPQNFAILPHDTRVAISWTAPASNGGDTIDGYYIYRGASSETINELVYTAGALEFSYDDTDVINGQYYYYKISAYNNGTVYPGGEGDLTSYLITRPITVPSAPQNFVAACHDSKVELTWTIPNSDGGDSIDGYYIYRGNSAGNINTLIYTANSAEFTYNDTGLVNGQYYFYTISAYNNGTEYPGGEGPVAESIIARPITVPSSPQNMILTPHDSAVYIEWETPSSNGGDSIDGYYIYRGITSNSITTLVYTAGAMEYNFNNTGLTNGQLYYYKVSAFNNDTVYPGGEGTFSNYASALPIRPPDAPTSFDVIPHDGYVNLTWGEPYNGGAPIEEYYIYRGDTADYLVLYDTVITGIYNYIDDDFGSGLENGCEYYYQISAVNNGTVYPGGEGAKTNVKLGLPIAPPNAPANFNAIPGNGQVLLTWTPPNDNGAPIQYYNITRGTSTGVYTYEIQIENVENLMYYIDTIDLQYGETYYYQIFAINNGSQYPGGAGDTSIEASAMPTLDVEFEILDASGNSIEDARILLEENDEPIDYSQIKTSDISGMVEFTGLNETNYSILIQKWDSEQSKYYTIYNQSVYQISTSLFNIQKSIICNLTNVIFTLKDLDGNIISDATVRLINSINSNINITKVTDENGQVEFEKLFNATWYLQVNYSTGENSYEFILNETIYVLNTAQVLYKPTITCNLKLISLTNLDNSLTPPYNFLYNANITLQNATTGENITSFFTDAYGVTEFRVPTRQYNISIQYLGKARTYYIDESGDSTFKEAYTIDFALNDTLTLQVYVSEMHTTIFLETIDFEKTLWDHTNNLGSSTPSLDIYYEDAIDFTLFWQNDKFLSGIDNATDTTGDWNSWEIKYNGEVLNSSTEAPYAIQPVSGEEGNYTFVFDSEQYLLSGTYSLSITMFNELYQDAKFNIQINVLNFTSSLSKISDDADLTGNWNDINNPIYIEVQYESVLPEIRAITTGIFYWNVVGTAESGILAHTTGNHYVLNWTASLMEGVYTIQIYGNATNYDFVLEEYIITVLKQSTQFDTDISPDYAINDIYLKAAYGENITINITYSDIYSNPLNSATIDIEFDGIELYDVYLVDDGIWQFTTEASAFTAGVYQIHITASLDHYISQETDIFAQVLESWNTRIEIVTPPESANWTANVSYTVYYSCIEEPRAGNGLENADIGEMAISYYYEGTEYPQIVLTSDNLGDLWGWQDLGEGYYLIWFNSSVANVSKNTMYYSVPIFNHTIYREGTIKPYVWISPLPTAISTSFSSVQDINKANIELVQFDLGDSAYIFTTFYVSALGHIYDENYLENAYLTYQITRTNDSLEISSGILGGGIEGLYYFDLQGNVLGEFTVKIIATLENYSICFEEFTLITASEIEITITIDPLFKINQNTLKTAYGENITFSITIENSELTSPVINIYIDDNLIEGCIYQSDSHSYIFTENADDFDVGLHEIEINVEKMNYISAQSTIYGYIIESWNTNGDIGLSSKILNEWGANITAVVSYDSNEYPREFELDSAEIQNITIYTKISGERFIQTILSSESINENWGFNYIVGDPNYGNHYQIWFNSSVLNLTIKTTFYIEISIEQTVYEEQILTTYVWIRPVETELTVLVENVIEMGFDLNQNIFLKLNVSDEDSGIFGKLLTGGTLTYVIKDGETVIDTGLANDLGTGYYSFNLYASQEGELTIIITSTLVNFTDASTTFTLIVRPGAVEFSVIIQENLRIDAQTLQAAFGENITFWIEMDSELDMNDVSISVKFANTEIFSSYVYQEETRLFLVSFPANGSAIGDYDLFINASKPNFVSGLLNMEIKVVESWKTNLELIDPPAYLAWNSNISFVVKYTCAEDPRTGLALANGIISGLKIDLITDNGVETQLILNSEDMGLVWGYKDLQATRGNGFYMIWFNTSFVSIPETRAFYAIPTIKVDTFEEKSVTPFIWIRPIQTNLDLSVEDEINLLLDGLTIEINEMNVIYAHLNITELNHILNGLNIEQAIISYQILNKDDNSLFDEGSLTETGNGQYQFDLDAVLVGEYIVKVQSTLLNYTTEIYSFSFTTANRTFNPQLQNNEIGGVVEAHQGQPLVFTIDTRDGLNGEPVINATLYTFLKGIRYNFTESSTTPGLYILTFTDDQIKELPDNEVYVLSCYLEKKDYDTTQFKIYLKVGLRVDPYLGIPYRYWTIMAVTLGVLVGIVGVRAYYKHASTPKIILDLERIRKIIKKGRNGPEKRLEKIPKEEMYSLYAMDWRLLGLDMKTSLNLSEIKNLTDSDKIAKDSGINEVSTEDFLDLVLGDDLESNEEES